MTYSEDLDLNNVQSSYSKNEYGHLFYSLVKLYRPSKVVELGTFYGYSALFIAKGLGENKTINSELNLIDLWSDYEYRHCSIEDTKTIFLKNKLLDLPNCKINFFNNDAFSSASLFQDNSIDFLHIDISNDGEKLQNILMSYQPKISKSINSVIVIEGGSNERDDVDWMRTYKKPKISEWLGSSWVKSNFTHFTFNPFPSLTILRPLL